MTNSEIIEKTKEEITLRGLTDTTADEYLKKLTTFMQHYNNKPIYEMRDEKIRKFLLHPSGR